jgi:hypothetical protein
MKNYEYSQEFKNAIQKEPIAQKLYSLLERGGEPIQLLQEITLAYVELNNSNNKLMQKVADTLGIT